MKLAVVNCVFGRVFEDIIILGHFSAQKGGFRNLLFYDSHTFA